MNDFALSQISYAIKFEKGFGPVIVPLSVVPSTCKDSLKGDIVLAFGLTTFVQGAPKKSPCFDTIRLGRLRGPCDFGSCLPNIRKKLPIIFSDIE